ncbi:hypothetical protein AYI70_g7908 [Smittium culicis]|uniref:CCHC-type domain-containing protein n=1 Tax=Smittium culicis TaxID=133412 RepID=A0A1R1XIF8_9FUNG|nr:hypothetical protein AYI70_g7908 [Smittium culicis]
MDQKEKQPAQLYPHNSGFLKLFEPKPFSNEDLVEESNWIRNYELFSRKNKWNEQDILEFLELYLDGKAISWFQMQEKIGLSWTKLRSYFIQKFEGQEAELRAWKELQNIHQEEDKGYRCLLIALKPKLQKSILKSKFKSYKESIKVAADEESLEKLINFENANADDPVERSRLMFRSDLNNDDSMYELLIKKFDQLNLNVLTLVQASIPGSSKLKPKGTEEKDLNKISCTYCKEDGHFNKNCPKSYWNKKRAEQSPTISIPNSNSKNLGCIEIANLDKIPEIFDFEIS